MITTRNQSRAVTAVREQLREIDIIRPEAAGAVWRGVQHGELVDTIDRQLQEHNVEITRESWVVSGANQECLAGSMGLRIPGLDAPEGAEFSLGLQHGNNLQQALKFAVGLKIFVCSNGMVTGDFVVRRRHTLRFDLDEVVGHGLDRYLSGIDQVGRDVDEMQSREYWGDEEVNRVLMQAGREGLMPWSRIGQVDQEFRHPTFNQHNQWTAWGLYNAFTFVAQKSPAHKQIDMMGRFRTMVLSN